MLTGQQVSDFNNSPEVDRDALDDFIDALAYGDVLPWQVLELQEIVDSLPTLVKMEAFEAETAEQFARKIIGLIPTDRQKELGIDCFTDGQKEVWESLRVNKITLVLSGNGLGKTFLAAIAALWLFYRGYAVITTAPTARQVKELLWAEIRTLKALAEVNTGQVLPGQWADAACEVRDPKFPKHTLMGYTARVRVGEMDATAFKGKHHSKMAVIVDEGIGVERAIFAAINALVLGDPESRVLIIGNPTDQQSYCYELEQARGMDGKLVAHTIHLSGEDHPNVLLNEIVIPGAVTKDFLDLQFALGGSKESAFYRTTVLGQWPGDVKDACIQMAWIERAKRRSEESDMQDAALLAHAETLKEDEKRAFLRMYFKRDNRGIGLGLDVAGEGDNLTVLTGCESGRIFYPKLSRPCWHVGKDHTHAVDLVITAIRELKRVLSISIDDTGLGAAVSAELWRRRDEFPAVPIFIVKGPLAEPGAFITQCVVNRINFGGKAASFDEEHLDKMRDSLYWATREALRLNRLNLPTDPEFRDAGFPPKSNLTAQFANPILWRDRKGMLHVLDKRDSEGPREKTKNLPTLSPDLAHSALLAFWAWRQLPERQSAPETVEEYVQNRVRAAMAKQAVQAQKDRMSISQAVVSPYARRAT